MDIKFLSWGKSDMAIASTSSHICCFKSIKFIKGIHLFAQGTCSGVFLSKRKCDGDDIRFSSDDCPKTHSVNLSPLSLCSIVWPWLESLKLFQTFTWMIFLPEIPDLGCSYGVVCSSIINSLRSSDTNLDGYQCRAQHTALTKSDLCCQTLNP